MDKLRVLSLFAGVGGFDLGLERTGGFETVAFCEIDPFARKVLAKHWPEVPCYHDVRDLTGARLAADGIAVDVICGGFPCQDISVAGKLAGIAEGTRSGLWSEIDRLIGELRPRFVIVENVANLLAGPSERPGGWFGRILGDLAERGYNAEWENIPAAALGAPHRRERIWIVGYPNESGFEQPDYTETVLAADALPAGPQPGILASAPATNETMADAYGTRWAEQRRSFPIREELIAAQRRGWWSAEPGVGRVAHGIPDRPHRIAALGNAVVPQIPELIGNAILRSITNDQFAAVARGDGGLALPRPADHRPAGEVTPAGTTALAENTPPGALGQRPLFEPPHEINHTAEVQAQS